MQTVDGVNIRGPIKRPHRDAEHYCHRDREDVQDDFRWHGQTNINIDGMVKQTSILMAWSEILSPAYMIFTMTSSMK